MTVFVVDRVANALFEQQVLELEHFAGHLARVAASWDDVCAHAKRRGTRAPNAEARRDEALARAADCLRWINRERKERS